MGGRGLEPLTSTYPGTIGPGAYSTIIKDTLPNVWQRVVREHLEIRY